MTVSHGPIVRTYRGRSLEELIPRIREELGPDAIILREREGLTGGVGGFFAQRCVEVDAQAPAGIDFYDEEEAVSPADEGGEPGTQPGYAEASYSELDASEEDVGSPYAQAAAQYAEAREPAWEPAAEPAPVRAEPMPVRAEIAPVSEPPTPSPTPDLTEELTFAQRLEQARRERESLGIAGAEASPSTATADTAAPATATATAPSAETDVRAPTPTPYPTGVRAKVKVRPKPTRDFATPPAATATPTPVAAPVAEPTAADSSHGAAQLDAAAAGAVARELIGHGISEAWAHELIVAAAAHLAPFADHDGLREAVRAGMAAGISAAPLLPSSGAAVAFVGAGGSGKTRCAAAMAVRYGRSSTLRVNVLTLTAGSRRGDVATLLDGRGIDVLALAGGAAADAVTRGRERGLVVIDTPAVSPGDGEGVAALADELEQAGLDAVYLTVPATLSASAARNLLDGLAPVGPTALVITHADETGDLGIVTELAYQAGLPIAFIHGGLQLDAALTIADPATVAARTLP